MANKSKASAPRAKNGLMIGAIVAGFVLLVVIIALVIAIFAVNRNNTISQDISADMGGTIVLGAFMLQVPPGALAGDATFRIEEISPDDSEFFSSLATRAVSVGEFFDITEFFEGAQTSMVDGVLYVTIPFDPSRLPSNYDKQRVALSYYDPTYQQWIPLPTVVNEEENTVSAPIPGPVIVAPVAWIEENQPPTVVNAYFSPSSFFVDCNALRADPDGWLQNNPYQLILHVSDPNGLEDIQDPPVVTFLPNNELGTGQTFGPYPMDRSGPGEFILEGNTSLVEMGIRDVFYALSASCGSTHTLKANITIRDTEGNLASANALMDIRYTPEPDIILLSPVGNQRVPMDPLLTWDFGNLVVQTEGGSVNTLDKYQSILLDVSTDSMILAPGLIHQTLPISERSFAVPVGTLSLGVRYYWQISLVSASGDVLRSQTQSFTTGEICQPDGQTSCLKISIRKIDGSTVAGAMVSLTDVMDAQSSAFSEFTDDSGEIVFTLAPEHSYVLRVSETPGTQAGSGEACPFTASANDFMLMELILEPGEGITDLCDALHQQTTFFVTRTPTVTPEPSATPQPSITPTPDYPNVTLDRDYFCNEGPGENYPVVTSFSGGTNLRVVGKSNGWWQVPVVNQRVPTCWVGGGAFVGDISAVPNVVVPPLISDGLVNVTVSQRDVVLRFRDSGGVDGDRIKVFLNNVVIISDLTLNGSGTDFPVTLNSGQNQVMIQALNEGDDYPNTVEVSLSHVIVGPTIQLSNGLNTNQTASFSVNAP